MRHELETLADPAAVARAGAAFVAERAIAAFNGGVFARPDMSVIEQRVIPHDLAPPVIELLGTHGMSVWVYRGADWFIRDTHGPHVACEARTVRFDPAPIASFASVSDGVAKIVG